MRLDEMIIKANADGKTYINDGYELPFTYSAKNGFQHDGKPWNEEYSMAYITGWEELPKRRLTVSEAEKELDCEIDTPDISKLFRSKGELPKPFYNVIIALTFDKDSSFTGFRSGNGTWYVINKDGKCENCNPVFWIDPADLIKLLPKE